MEAQVNSGDVVVTPPGSRRARRKFSFIAVHLGAGEHALKNKEMYKKICDDACSKGKAILRSGGPAGDAVTEATKVLENSGILNAGCGSSLTIDGAVECDAGFMDGSGYFGGVGAVPGIPNPILVAKSIADVHRKEKLFSCGRVPPNFLVGQKARDWAQGQSIPVCDNEDLISSTLWQSRARKTFAKYKGELRSAAAEVNDTIGAVAVDAAGHVASTVSSGGNWMKVPGRVGHSPMFGCGCWSSNSSDRSTSAIALSASGSGEMLSRVRLPQECACVATSEEDNGLVGSVSSCVYKHFLHNSSLNIHTEPRYLGLLALMWDGTHGELVWGHTTQNFVVGYSSSKMRSTHMTFSELNPASVAGKSLKVEGILL